jgi:hypothetical protein
MQRTPSNGGADTRLRFIFSGAVKSFDLPVDATLGDVALKLGDPALRGYGKPVGIDIAWAAAPSRGH